MNQKPVRKCQIGHTDEQAVPWLKAEAFGCTF